MRIRIPPLAGAAVLAAFLSCPAVTAAPGLGHVAIWHEAEQFDDQFGELGPERSPAASNGSVLDGRFPTSTRNWVSYLVTLPQRLPDAQLIIRYASSYPGTCQILVETDDQLPVSKPILALGPTAGDGLRATEFACAAVHLGPLAAGTRRIRLIPLDPVRQSATQPAVGELSETPTSLSRPSSTPNVVVSSAILRIDGFFIADAAEPVPPGLWDFVAEFNRANLATRPELTDALESAAARSPLRLVVAQETPWEAIPRSLEFLPAKDHLAQEVKLTAAVNEFASAAFSVLNLGGRQSVTFSLEPSEVRKRCLIRIVGQYNSRWYGPVFDPLFTSADLEPLPDLARAVANWSCVRTWPNVAFSPLQSHLLWITWDTRDLAPGPYTAEIEIRGDQDGKHVIPLSLTVRPIVLPKDNPLLSYTFCATTDDEVRIADMLDHGINVFRSNPYADRGTAIPPGHRAAKSLGAKLFLFRYTPGWGLRPIEGREREEECRRCIRDILASVKALGLKPDEWAVQLGDEPNAKHVSRIKDYVRLARQVQPDIRIWLDPGWSGNAIGSLTQGHGLKTFFEPLRNDVGAWCPFVGHLWREDEPIYSFLRSTGAELWFYKNASIWSKEPRACFGWYRKVSWIAWKYRTRGAGLWNLASFYGDPWDDFDKTYPDAAFVYKGRGDRLIGSRVYESYRQGVQEYKRLWWLDRLLAAAEAPSRPDRVVEAKRERLEIEQVVDRAISANTAKDMEDAREALDEKIERLQRELSMSGRSWSDERWHVDRRR